MAISSISSDPSSVREGVKIVSKAHSGGYFFNIDWLLESCQCIQSQPRRLEVILSVSFSSMYLALAASEATKGGVRFMQNSKYGLAYIGLVGCITIYKVPRHLFYEK